LCVEQADDYNKNHLLFPSNKPLPVSINRHLSIHQLPIVAPAMLELKLTVTRPSSPDKQCDNALFGLGAVWQYPQMILSENGNP
jgi:hypothetical protein